MTTGLWIATAVIAVLFVFVVAGYVEMVDTSSAKKGEAFWYIVKWFGGSCAVVVLVLVLLIAGCEGQSEKCAKLYPGMDTYDGNYTDYYGKYLACMGE